MLEQLGRVAAYLVLGALCGLWLSDYMSADLAQVQWTNFWVYFWLLLWPLGLVAHLFMWLVVLLKVALALAVIALIATGVGVLFARRRP